MKAIFMMILVFFFIGCKDGPKVNIENRETSGVQEQIDTRPVLERYLYLFENRKYEECEKLLSERYKKNFFAKEWGASYLEYYQEDPGWNEQIIKNLQIIEDKGNGKYVVSYLSADATYPEKEFNQRVLREYHLKNFNKEVLIDNILTLKVQMKKNGEWVDSKVFN